MLEQGTEQWNGTECTSCILPLKKWVLAETSFSLTQQSENLPDPTPASHTEPGSARGQKPVYLPQIRLTGMRCAACNGVEEGGAVGTVLCVSALAELQSGTVTGEKGE